MKQQRSHLTLMSIFALSIVLSPDLKAESTTSYDFWSHIASGNTENFKYYPDENKDNQHYNGVYSSFYPRSYEKDLSLRFWAHIIDPEEEARKQAELKKWVKEANLYLMFFKTPNQSHFRKKIAMANLSFAALKGGMEDFHLSAVPYLKSSIIAAQKARYHSMPEDGFSKRIEKTQNLLISSLLDSDYLVDKNIEDMLAYASSSDFKAFQKPVYYEVLGTSLISSYKRKYIEQGVNLLAESIRLLDTCTTSDCDDALTLAPAYKIMTLLTLAEGYAMLGDLGNRDNTFATMRNLAVEKDWPFLPVINAYLNDIDDLTNRWSRSEQIKLIGITTGLKKPMPYVFKPINACRYCHVGQTSVPEYYLPH